MSVASIASTTAGSTMMATAGPLGSGAWPGPPGPWQAIVHDADETVKSEYPQPRQLAVHNRPDVTDNLSVDKST